MSDTVIHTRSLGTASEGVKDQYADGKAAKVWEYFIGDQTSRTQTYKTFLINLLRQNGCKRILDVACGTGVDSIMLVEEGFEMVSIDASDKMLKYALKARWSRRKEPAFDRWVIEEANWITLHDDIKHFIGDGFDAVICLGNSFAHLMDSFGDQREQKQAVRNFEKCVKPGGFLLIDHRNYDYIIKTGQTPSKCFYYNSQHTADIQTSVLYVSGKPSVVMMDYFVEVPGKQMEENNINEFRLSYYPHKFEDFKAILVGAFGKDSKYKIYGDFEELEANGDPNFYIHLIQKTA